MPLFTIVSKDGFCQADSLRLSLDLIFGVDRFFQNSNKETYLPGSIIQERALNSGIVHDFLSYTDIPQFHASSFTGLLTHLELKKGYDFHFDLFAEDRGQSFGSLALDKITLFPRIYGSIKDSVTLNGEHISVTIKAGDFLKYQHNHGLTINNIDVQGAVVRLQLNQTYFNYTLIADLSAHVGLNIEEFYSYKLGYQEKKISTNIDFNLSFDHYRLIDDTKYNLVFNGKIEKKRNKFFIESAFNPYNQNLAFLVGYHKSIDIENLKFESELSYRFYGSSFNEGFLEPSVRFRDLSTPTLTNNSIGNFLYPLINAYRPFDQWSVYTEYGNKQIHSLRLFTHAKHRVLLKQLFIFINYEGIFIGSEKTESHFYNFYEVGFSYALPLETKFHIYTTNKIMNLDVHYQTFYQSNLPVFGFSIRRLLSYE